MVAANGRICVANAALAIAEWQEAERPMAESRGGVR